MFAALGAAMRPAALVELQGVACDSANGLKPSPASLAAGPLPRRSPRASGSPPSTLSVFLPFRVLLLLWVAWRFLLLLRLGLRVSSW